MAQSFDQLPYLPDRNEYDTRMFRYAQEGPVEKILPHGFPQRLTADMAWEGGNISMNHAAGSESPYLLILQAPQLVEIDAALKHFQSQPATLVFLAQD